MSGSIIGSLKESRFGAMRTIGPGKSIKIGDSAPKGPRKATKRMEVAIEDDLISKARQYVEDQNNRKSPKVDMEPTTALDG
ncbi:MAG: hypothetical protein Q9170_003987 [Blastenia crenularia]